MRYFCCKVFIFYDLLSLFFNHISVSWDCTLLLLLLLLLLLFTAIEFSLAVAVVLTLLKNNKCT
jgi:hypothetical protein